MEKGGVYYELVMKQVGAEGRTVTDRGEGRTVTDGGAGFEDIIEPHILLNLMACYSNAFRRQFGL